MLQNNELHSETFILGSMTELIMQPESFPRGS